MVNNKRRPAISTRLRPRYVAGALALVIVAGAGLWYVTRQNSSAGEVSTDQYGDRVQTVAPGQLPVFAREAGTKAREAYRFASSAEGKILDWIPCYCGCKNIGHRHNRDCYLKSINPSAVTFTSHGAT